MEPAKNGFIITYNEREVKKDKNTYDNCCSYDRREVFSEDTEGDIEKAFDRFKELAMRQYTELKSKG